MCEYVFVYALTHSRRIPAASPCSPSLINQPQCQFIHSGAACGHSCVLWMPDGLLRQIFEGRNPPLSICSGSTATQLQFQPTLPCKIQQFIKSLAEQVQHLVWFDISFIISLNKKKALGHPMHLMYIALRVTFKSPSAISFSRVTHINPQAPLLPCCSARVRTGCFRREMHTGVIQSACFLLLDKYTKQKITLCEHIEVVGLCIGWVLR